MKLIRIYLFLASFILSSNKCNNKDEKFIYDNSNSIFRQFHNSNKEINYNGVYIVYWPILDKENKIKYEFQIPKMYGDVFVFFNNGFSNLFSFHAYTDSSMSASLMVSQNNFNIQFGGAFYTKEKKVKTIVDLIYVGRGTNFGTTTAIFEGDIINPDTIINFRMVPPYPRKFNWYDTMPTVLVFQKFPAKLLLDSTKYTIKKYLTQ